MTGIGSARSARRSALAPLLLLLAYLALALAYQRAVPLFEAPDEPSHVLFVAFVSTTGGLPHTLERRDVPGEGMEPPLYYLLQVPLYRAIAGYDPALLQILHESNLRIYQLVDWRATAEDAPIRMVSGSVRTLDVDPAFEFLRSLRWGSLLVGVLAVLSTFAAARRVSGSTAFASLCALLLAFSPQFLFVSAYVNNDVPAAALGGAAFWLFAAALSSGRVGRAHYAAAALGLALAFATKHSALPSAAVCGLALFAIDARPWRARLPDLGLAALLGLLLAAPVLWTNLARFGDPTGVGAMIASSTVLSSDEKFGGLGTYFRTIYPYTTFCSYWATFGWLNVVAPYWLYLAFFALTWSGGLGFLLGWRAERLTLAASPAPEGFERAQLLRLRALRRYLAATIVATFAAHIWINFQAAAPQGRHLFGAAPQIAALLAMGIASLGGAGALVASGRMVLGIGGAMAALALVGLRMIVKAYA